MDMKWLENDSLSDKHRLFDSLFGEEIRKTFLSSGFVLMCGYQSHADFMYRFTLERGRMQINIEYGDAGFEFLIIDLANANLVADIVSLRRDLCIEGKHDARAFLSEIDQRWPEFEETLLRTGSFSSG